MVTIEQIQEIMPTTCNGRAKNSAPHLQEAMDFFDINTPKRKAAFLGHVAFESAELLGRPKSRIDSNPFQRRGWIPMNGKDDYFRMKVFSGMDFIRNPEMIETMKWSAWAAAYLWHRDGGNQYADTWDLENIVRNFSLRISADDTDRRTEYFRRAAKAFGISMGVPQVS